MASYVNGREIEVGEYTVTATISHIDESIVHLTIDGELLQTTSEHPFFTDDEIWVNAGELEIGERVLSLDGDYGTVEAVVVVEEANQPMYNLTVAEVHTFIVGDGEWVVHNDEIDGIVLPDNVVFQNGFLRPRGTTHPNSNTPFFVRRTSLIEAINSVSVQGVSLASVTRPGTDKWFRWLTESQYTRYTASLSPSRYPWEIRFYTAYYSQIQAEYRPTGSSTNPTIPQRVADVDYGPLGEGGQQNQVTNLSLERLETLEKLARLFVTPNKRV